MSTTGPRTLDSAIFNPTLYRQILNFWFSDLPLPASAPPWPTQQRWFGIGLSPEAKSSFDKDCCTVAEQALSSIAPERYSLPDATSSSAVEIDGAIASPFASQLKAAEGLEPEETALALILLLDQFPRNCFRSDNRQCFLHYDRIARALLHHFIIPHELDVHERYVDSPPWRMWFYLPLEHSEDLKDHNLCERKLEDILKTVEKKGDEKAVDFTKMFMDFERKHKVILERFGRYPHRNRAMGRESTQEEKEYLDNGGETFGG